MHIFLISAIITLYSLQTFFCTLYNSKFKGREDLSSPVFCIIQSVFVVIFTFIWMAFDISATPESFSARWVGFCFDPSLTTIGIGLLNGVALFCYNTAIIKAGAKGSYAFMNVMILFGGIMLPAIYEMFTGVSLEFHHYIAIAVMLVALVLMNYKDIKLKGAQAVYYLYCILLFIANGLYGTCLKLQSAYNENESNEMIIITFGLMGIIAFVKLALKEKGNTFDAFKMGKAAVFPLTLCILIAAIAINIYMLLIPLLGNTVTILYTLDNGGVLVLSAIYSVVFFKERPDAMKIAGIILAVISIIALAINSETIISIKELLA